MGKTPNLREHTTLQTVKHKMYLALKKQLPTDRPCITQSIDLKACRVAFYTDLLTQHELQNLHKHRSRNEPIKFKVTTRTLWLTSTILICAQERR